MTDPNSWGHKVMGWFVVQDGTGEPAAKPDNADSAADPRIPVTGPPLNVFTTPPPAPSGGQIDFEKVFEAAGIDADARQRVGRTLDLLNSLPAGTDPATKKQIVTASLKAFGVPVDQIIESSAEELQALEAYIRAGASDVEKVASEAQERIRKFEEEIANLKTVMQQRVEDQNTVVHSCNARKLEIQKVLEFFGQEAVGRVVRESPKLQEPQPNG